MWTTFDEKQYKLRRWQCREVDRPQESAFVVVMITFSIFIYQKSKFFLKVGTFSLSLNEEKLKKIKNKKIKMHY